jgi:muramoyltetrapeptide carboxypeptidase
MLHIPPYLVKGDQVVLAATARKISSDELRPAVEYLQSRGLEVLFTPGLFDTHHQFAGTDVQRAAAFQWALSHPTAKAILIVRGGYGTVRIIDNVQFDVLRQYPKWICGYSDVTVLHSHLHQLNWASLHCTMPINFTKHAGAVETLLNALQGEPLRYPVAHHALNRAGRSTAIVTGGNLSLLYALSGSVSDVDTGGKLLFIEDLDEYLYHIDRMMLQLKRAGKLKNLAGLIVGGMSDMKDNAVPFGQSAEQIIRSAIEEYSFPVCFGFPAGHIDENNAIYFGKHAQLEVTESGAILEYV